VLNQLLTMNTVRKSLVSAQRLTIPLLALALLLLAGRPAQSQTMPKGKGHTTMNMPDESMVMKNGKMMMMEHGKMTPMTADMTMSDGTICMTDGTCKYKNGTVMKMKDGDRCMMENGKMMIHSGSTSSHHKASHKMSKTSV
jgi:hypothetical protein